jgi:hypothetical protein
LYILCCGGREGAIPPETFIHLFYDCPHTSEIRTAFTNRLVPEIAILSNTDKKLFCLCSSYMGTNNLTIGVTSLIINFFLWECKLHKSRLSSLSSELDYSMSKCFALSRKMRHSCKSINLTMFRNWAASIGREYGDGEREDEEEE